MVQQENDDQKFLEMEVMLEEENEMLQEEVEMEEEVIVQEENDDEKQLNGWMVG